MDETRAFIDRVSEEHLRHHLFYLAKDPLPFRRLNYTVPGRRLNTLYEADAFIEGELRRYGYQVEREACPVQAFGFDPQKPIRHSYAAPPPGAPVYTAYNLYARKVGRTYPDEIIVLVAHKDSQSWIDSPGAYDNAVGTVAVLELARLLADDPTERSFCFLFCNEEHTPWTSVVAAENARRRGDNLVAIYNLDGLGGRSDEEVAAGRRTNVTLYTYPEGRRFAELMAEVNRVYAIGLEQSAQQRPFPNDDDGSFVKAGYTWAVANSGSFPYGDAEYHLPGDGPERVDVVNLRMAAQATLAAVRWIDQGKA